MAGSATSLIEPTTSADRNVRIDYPSSDGLMLLGTDRHETAVHLGREALDRHFRGERELFIATLMALYYTRGKPSQYLVPDLMVARGVRDRSRRSFKTWTEGGVVSQFVLEVASKSTRDRDCGFKLGEYERIGVREYWQLDQTGHLLEMPLLGHRLRRGRYQRLGPSGQVGGFLQYRSIELGLLLRARRYRRGLTVVFRDPYTGKDILTGEETDRALAAAKAQARTERQSRLAAERLARRHQQALANAEERIAKLEQVLRRTGGSPDDP